MIESKDVKKVQKRLGVLKHKAPDVISRALNRAATNLKSNVVKKTREEYNIKAKTIRSTIRIERATRTSLSAKVISEGNKEPITSYLVLPRNSTAKKSKALVRVAVKKGDAKTLLSAFVVSKYGGVYERENKERFPIKQIYGPSVPQILGNEETEAYVMKEAWNMYKRRVDHEINRLLEAKS